MKRIFLLRFSLKRDIEHEQRVTLEVESWLNDRRIYLKGMHKFWAEKSKADIAAKDQARKTTTVNHQ